MTKKNIIGYGELLLRLTPKIHGNLIEQSDTMNLSFAGAEANILADLALWGHKTAFISAFPKNPIGRSADLFLRRFGIDTDHVVWDEGRLGSYFIEHGTSIRGTRVTYDRKGSSMTMAEIPAKDWEHILRDAQFFILTGITPALSSTCQKNITVAIEIAKGLGVPIVFDLNYRRTLWKKGNAKSVFESILPHVNILLANIGSASDIFDIKTKPFDTFAGLEQATTQAMEGLETMGNFDMAMTLRLQQTANKNILGGMIKKDGNLYASRPQPTEIIDRLGGGDAFAAAILHGILRNWPMGEVIEYATAAFAVTQTLQGDINYMTEEEISALTSGNTSGYVNR